MNSDIRNVITAFNSSLALLISLIAAKLAYQSNAHGESGWRKKLLNLASTYQVQDKDILVLQSLVNPIRISESFKDSKDIDGLINYFCTQANLYLEYNTYLPKNGNNHINAEKFRYLGRVLLKDDWIKQTGHFFNKKVKRRLLFKKAKETFEDCSR